MLDALESQVTAIKEASLLRRRVLARLEKEIAAEPVDIRDQIREYAEVYLSTICRNSIKQYSIEGPEFCTGYKVAYHKRGAQALLLSETGMVLNTLYLRSGRLARLVGKRSLKKMFMGVSITPIRPAEHVRLEGTV